MKIELFKDKSLHDSAMENFDLLYSQLFKISAPSYREAFVALVYSRRRAVSSGCYGIDPRDGDPHMQAEFILRGGYACRLRIAFKHPVLVLFRFENLLTAAYFFALFEEAGKAYDKIARRKPRNFIEHCQAVASQVDMYARRIKDELAKY